MNFRIAHFSDLHFGPLPAGAPWRNFRAKRVLGALSWHFSRKRHHLPYIADALRDDILRHRPDHVAFTGDGTNIAAHAEFPRLAAWMQGFGLPENLSYVPGNHDAYVKTVPEKTLGLLMPWMQGEMRGEQPFPYVRLRRNVALIGLNSALPRGFQSAEGKLGRAQREALRWRLADLKGKGFYRLVMIHHPPLTGVTTRLRSLTDAFELTEILQEVGAEMVIHGHDHRRELHWVKSEGMDIPVVGVPSGSLGGSQHPAEWNLYDISRANGRWQTEVSIRRWHEADHAFQPAATVLLEKPA